MTKAVIDRKTRMRLPEQHAPLQDPAVRRQNWDEVCLGFTLQQALAEANRCIFCPAAPCQQACPLHNDIPGAIGLLETGDTIGAAERFRLTSPMPDVCSRVCPQERLCEGSCVLGKRGAPVRIGKIERFVTDAQRAAQGLPPMAVAAPSGRSVAVVGAGPAGIAAAEDLRRTGHRVVVFDAWPAAGGVLRYGIPTFKLPKSLVTAIVVRLEKAGVGFVGDRRIDGGGGLAALRAEGFDAVVLAVGASAPVRLGVPGEDLAGVWTATDFLVRANLPPDDLPPAMQARPAVGERVVVIGGGDTAMDCCRSAVRLGAAEVLCLYRRTEAEMPGRTEERSYARDEGVRFEFLAAPLRFLGENGAVVGVECTRMALSEPDARGRRSVVPVPDSSFAVPANTVVVAAGYRVDRELGEAAPDLARRADGAVVVDPETGATNLPGVYAAGDATTGPDLVVTAAAAGRRAAAAIDAYLKAKTA
ncbi:MAG: NAD(P)-dependent oxidoreductase [Chloroflexi bacterium]|nr:NAD(P)-dependent oxidoreductase [Chloroflexota bacterium]